MISLENWHFIQNIICIVTAISSGHFRVAMYGEQGK